MEEKGKGKRGEGIEREKERERDRERCHSGQEKRTQTGGGRRWKMGEWVGLVS